MVEIFTLWAVVEIFCKVWLNIRRLSISDGHDDPERLWLW
jgi:hypothetical protein